MSWVSTCLWRQHIAGYLLPDHPGPRALSLRPPCGCPGTPTVRPRWSHPNVEMHACTIIAGHCYPRLLQRCCHMVTHIRLSVLRTISNAMRDKNTQAVVAYALHHAHQGATSQQKACSFGLHSRAALGTALLAGTDLKKRSQLLNCIV